MTQEKIKGIIAKAGITITRISDGVLWTFKGTAPSEALIAKGVELLEEAGYQIEGSGVAGEYVFIRVVNPIHAEGYVAPEKPAPAPEPTPAPEPEEGTLDVLNSLGQKIGEIPAIKEEEPTE